MSSETTLSGRPLLEIRKYQNRRYYDTTHSEHLSLEQIHRKICEGHAVRVVDAKTETDITSKVLAQILLEYEPLKLDFFSPELLTQVIRVNDRILKDFFEAYFEKAFGLFLQSKEQFERMMRQAHWLPGAYSGTEASRALSVAMEAFNPLGAVFGQAKGRRSQSERDLAREVDALREQIEALKQAAAAASGPGGKTRRR